MEKKMKETAVCTLFLIITHILKYVSLQKVMSRIGLLQIENLTRFKF